MIDPRSLTEKVRFTDNVFTRSGPLRDTLSGIASSYFSKHASFSLPSTLVLPRSISPPTSAVQRRIVLRALRYVSPRPWGSPLAEAGRHRDSLEAIAREIFPAGCDTPRQRSTAFTNGASVLWRSVVFRGDGTFTPGRTSFPPNESAVLGWVAHRAPPRKAEESLIVDISKLVADHIGSCAGNGTQPLEVLWDCRWNVTVSADRLPEEIKEAIRRDASCRVMIRPVEPFQLPEVVMTRGQEVTVLGGFEKGWNAAQRSLSRSPWVDFDFIRTLAAI